ncbi:unnamed protein product [Angiostrongylus costaricensis]|uniref:TPR_REGION domain-containing protein n=1 Tax=Angiostrongylus costaricensis TaxID=334426 RepID=A0A0R3PDK3_ANGCS|nr:unnamed protein product [Angiostrongylus costaricensis]
MKQYECMPSLALDVLVKAHEKLGKAKKCGDNEFLLFFMKQLHICISNEKLMKLLQTDGFLWLWSNVSEEISQCLHCVFGRYSKRRRVLEDHECSVNHSVLNDYSVMILELAMPHPLPKYDDKVSLSALLEVLNCIRARVAFSIVIVFSLKWPMVNNESYVQSCVWYLMALHHYRQSNHNEIEIYSKVDVNFLLCTIGLFTFLPFSTFLPVAFLPYLYLLPLFKMDDDLLYLEWPWHVIPFRVSILVDSTVGVVFFQLANTLYQIATRLSRYFLTVPSDDWRLRYSTSVLRNLRQESQSLFEEALSQAFHWETGGICEYQWLCYFFLAKLQTKLDEDEVAVDGFYEAACSCELSEFFYPIKISVKKQQNIEPVEVHYQIHATVWKYLRKKLEMILEFVECSIFSSVQVVRSNLSLFSAHPEIHEALIYMTIDCNPSVEDGVAECLTCERFPHMKSYYRLAEMELSQGNIEVAYVHLLKHVFRRRKRDDSLFDVKFILKERHGALLTHAVSRLHILAMESSSPKHLRSDMYRAWQAVSK